MTPQFTLLDKLWYKDLSIHSGSTILWPVNKWFGKAWRLELESRTKLSPKGLILSGNWSPVNGGTGRWDCGQDRKSPGVAGK